MVKSVSRWMVASLVGLQLMAAEPVQMGGYIGSIPANIDFDRRDGYPIHYGMWAGHVYLFKNKIDIADWVGDAKTKMIKEGLKTAKTYAKKRGYKYFAVDNIRFQVVEAENRVELYFDGNVVVWK